MATFSVKTDLDVLMHGLAARDFRRRYPNATEEGAEAHAARHAGRYRTQAIRLLTMLVIEEETGREARTRQN
jgi:hypothetical protein